MMKEENITNLKIKIDFPACVYSHFALKLTHKHSKRSKRALFASFGTKLLDVRGYDVRSLALRLQRQRTEALAICGWSSRASLNSGNNHHQPR